jgi:uncharacterized protein (DUF1919 family)
MLRTVKSLPRKAIDFLRTKYKQKRIKSLTNTNPSIICNNCVGGIIYHDLGLKFQSPTINLFIEDKDYIEFLQNLDYYINATPIELQSNEYSYPLGIINRGDNKITIHFMHYETFESACNKWKERAQRVNFDNLYVIFDYPQKISDNDELIKCFCELPYKNKLVLADCSDINITGKPFKHINAYKSNTFPGKLINYNNKFSIKRNLDEFDYVSFLNNHQ